MEQSMPIDIAKLEKYADEYIQNMTSIRGRRIRRLIIREFGQCNEVRIIETRKKINTFFGDFENGDTIKTETDGRGKKVEVCFTRNGNNKIEVRNYDLLKDSLPLIDKTYEMKIL
jgi:hypothetical protein